MKPDSLDLLLQGLLDGALDEASRSELNQLLRASPEARSRYRLTAALHGALIRRTSSQLPAFLPDPAPVRRPRSFSWKAFTAIAAVLLGIAAIGLFARHQAKPRAQILSSTGTVWPEGVRQLSFGKLPLSNPVEILSGIMEIGYPSGARVVIEGPCRFSLDRKEALTVLHGRASVHTPDGAQGFRLDTPGGNFIDLGTKFGVAVGSDGTRPVVLTEVFEGEIEVVSSTNLRLTRGQSRAIIHRDDQPSLIKDLDESPVHVANILQDPSPSYSSPELNLALGKPVFSPGFCARPHGSVFPPDNLTDGRINDSGVPGDWSFWLAPDGESGEFTVDLLQPETISRVSLQNTSNRRIDDRGTETFTLFASLDNKTFTPLAEGELPRIDVATTARSFPFHDFNFPSTEARYVKLVVTSHYRDPKRPADHPCQGGGLNEIRIFAE